MTHSSFPDNGAPDSSPRDLEASFALIERRVLDLEPKVRELNRQLVGLLGKCPTGESGNWAYLATDGSDDFYVAFESLPMDKVLQLVARSAHILDALEEEFGFNPSVIERHHDLGPAMIGEAAQLAFVPTTHVRVVRPS